MTKPRYPCRATVVESARRRRKRKASPEVDTAKIEGKADELPEVMKLYRIQFSRGLVAHLTFWPIAPSDQWTLCGRKYRWLDYTQVPAPELMVCRAFERLAA